MRDATNTLARRVKNIRIQFAKNHTQISINKLRDRKQGVSQPIHKSDIIQGEAVIYLDDADTKHLTFLVIPKVTCSLCDRGMRLENHFLFPVMCHEQPESMSHVPSKPLSITYIGREKGRWLSAGVSEINLRNPTLNHVTRRSFHSPLHLTT
jgi:hypothetical protein